MTRYSHWEPRKNRDYQFFDENIQDLFDMGATSIYVHKYVGTKNTKEIDEWINNNADDPFNIQDILFLENRDRSYDPHIYELLGVHNVQDLEFSMSQFAMLLEADVLFITFHINDSIRRLGRKLMPGDVLELPHLRDDALLGDRPAINKYYVIDEITRPAEGFSPTWWPHLYRAKCKPMSNSEEFKDILDQPGTDANGDPLDNGSTLGDIIGNYDKEIDLTNQLEAAADKAVHLRNFDSMQKFYIVKNDDYSSQYGWVFASGPEAPNGKEVTVGEDFPDNPTVGMFFLRTDMEPNVLFEREEHYWRRHNINLRTPWTASHRILTSFMNNDTVTTIDGKSFAEKTPLSKAITNREKK